jgi:mevalonate kinase
MDFDRFTTSAHGKCLLAGEHAVLSGCPAIILPVREKKIDLTFTTAGGENGEMSPENALGEIFQTSLNQAVRSLNHTFPDEIQGNFQLQSNIEMGAGLGFSAALCVVISRWLVWKEWIQEIGIFDFAKNLENLHHGQSSGVDIAGAMSDQMIHFEAASTYLIESKWHPKLYLSYSGMQKNTKGAIEHVKRLKDQNPLEAALIEEQMRTSVWEIEESLKHEEKLGKQMLISGLERAKRCFEEWGLISPILREHLTLLDQLGALAAKPTGAGLGGYVLSLWDQDPPEHEKIEWIAL